ncbi:alpha-L-fucosidase [Pedobacter sp. HDW13]|uniref:alpha-L-fucosidase n=1 Tax=unclassified Pedobacter TaxID=2628915 RepID=UPI000F597F10|nr:MULTISPECIES: alpha-L-fucosidase [unclassified Pedobacter]QIL42246.1 alpha-L-fucosidase [Pedobacter sp. HDW13]RQO76512.1 alpha-L-fucosidase [Pedobacter sp. KBW01]
MKQTKFIYLLLFGLLSNLAYAQTKTNPAVMKDFMDKRFGMFIHWGPVSLRGTEIGWSRDKQVEKTDYDNLYKEFDPTLFNADDIVKTAKDAGMKYLTITARHHDGFCLWPSKFTEYDIAHTPYKKDIVGALNEACKKQGIKFCIYYSVLDWYHPDYPIHSSASQTIDPKADMTKYVSYMKNQLKELITNYDPYMLWFDGQWEKPWTDEMGKDLYSYLKKLKPDVIINNRLGKEFAAMENKKIDHSKMVGDYDTPEQTVGHLNMDTPWESCFTICNQWAWKPNDKMKSLKDCLTILSKTAGGNGNLLLNVGPMPDGRIEARQITRLKEIGQWLKTNSEAVYGTFGGPYQPTDAYATTRKGNKLFVHVLKTDADAISLKNIPARKAVKANILGGEKVSVEQGATDFKISLPKNQAGALQYVIAIEMDGDIEKTAVIN